MAMSFTLQRHFTGPGKSTDVEWNMRPVAALGCDVEAPAAWSDTAVEIAATRYFRRREGEFGVRQLLNRVVHAVRHAGEKQGYFTGGQAEIFADELMYVLVHQIASFNSPVYFNVGIFPTYGFAGASDNYVWDPAAGKAVQQASAFIHPQASACFIQDVKDDLLSIFDLLKSEAKLFKYGSGTGTNFSRLRARGEPLDGGGESTGLISYLEIYDRAAGAIKSGGTVRRAAKMVLLDADHPEILDFIHWKRGEERKARVLLAAGYSGGMDGEAFRSVSGQNSNNSVRVTDRFLHAVLNGGKWELRARKGGRVVAEVSAAEILREMSKAAWECADPGIQFQDTIERWHMCPNSGPIRASNPCSEYMFLDDSACNLSSLNLVSFLRGNDLDWLGFAQAVRLMLLAQEILVDYSSYPTAMIAANSHRFRPLGLGYANLGGLLMRLGIAYDSEAAAEWTARITGTMHALALKTSHEMAVAHGAFAGWAENREPGLAVLARHAEAWRKLKLENGEAVSEMFKQVEEGARSHGLRNAQVTLIAPTGTIGLLMDCDTLGIEPDFALVKRKTLTGGGELRLVNQAVSEALVRLQYTADAVAAITAFVHDNGTVVGAPGLKPEHAAIFDCALAPPGQPARRVSSEGHLRVMAAAQPFLSGAISKTVNLPGHATVEEIEQIFLSAWHLGLKSLAVYRDTSKAVQPLCAEC